MNVNKFIGIIFASLLIVLTVTSIVSAIGLAPASKEMLLTKNNYEYELKIYNTEKEEGQFNLVASGELAEYISFDKNSVMFDENEEFEIVQIKLNLPQNANLNSGEHVTRIVVQKDNQEIKDVAAIVGIASKLIVTVPYEGAFLDVKIVAPEFTIGTNNHFSIETENRGTENANNCKVTLEVDNQENVNVLAITSEQKTIITGEKEIFTMPWDARVENGNYVAKAKVICDNFEITKEEQFKVGSPEITIDSLSVDKFTLGDIVKFDLVLASNWGEKIDNVYLDVELYKDNSQVARAKTESVGIDAFSKFDLPFYIDTNGMQEGEYVLVIKVNYLGKQVIESYDAYITPDKLTFSELSGNVVAGEEPEDVSSDLNVLLLAACLMIIVVNIILVIKHRHKHKKNNY